MSICPNIEYSIYVNDDSLDLGKRERVFTEILRLFVKFRLTSNLITILICIGGSSVSLVYLYVFCKLHHPCVPVSRVSLNGGFVIQLCIEFQ